MRDNEKVKDKAVYVVAGINRERKKEVLGFWINILNELKAKRVEDVLIFSIDNLKGISKAIKVVYPKSEIQKCVVHQIRNSLKYVSWKEKKEIDLTTYFRYPYEIRKIMYTTNIIVKYKQRL